MDKRSNNLPKLKHFRRKLRANMTPAEATLWKHLSKKQLKGRKFRRQHSIEGYILDFCSAAEKLAIELDGQTHDTNIAAEYDLERTKFLEAYGIEVIRFENCTVFESIDWVLNHIRDHFQE